MEVIMRYRKIRASWKDDRDTLNRLFLIDESLSVLEFTVILQKLLHMEFSHLFQIMFSKRYFQPARFSEYGCENIESLSWDDLPRKFSFEYDFGDSWMFEIFVFKKLTEINDTRPVILLEGSGAGIWEDERYAFTLYKNEGELPQQDEYEDFMPWNLDYLKDLNSTLDYMHEQEQARIEAFMAEEFEQVVSKLQNVMSCGDHWDAYNGALSIIRIPDLDEKNQISASIRAITGFFNAVEAMSQQGVLPKTMEELQSFENGPDDYTGIIDDVPDILLEQGKYEYCLETMKKLQFFFPQDEELKHSTDGAVMGCLCGLSRFEEAHKLLDEYDQILDDPQMKAVNRARVNLAEGKLAEAERLLAPYISEDTEATEDNYRLLMCAYELYRQTDPAKAEMISDKLDQIDQLLFPDEDDTGFTEANEELRFAVERFRDHQSQYRYSIASAVFIMLYQDNGNVILPLSGDMNPKVTIGDGAGQRPGRHSG